MSELTGVARPVAARDASARGGSPADPVGRLLLRLSYGLAVGGGTLMAALTVMVVLSILGRSLFSTPIYGDFELVAMGTAISVAMFLPYCQMRRGNVIVDLFLARAPVRVQAALDALGALMLAVLSGGLAWRAVLGGWDMFSYNEVTMILAIPVWWAFPWVAGSLALLALTALYGAWRDLLRCRA